MLKRIDSYEQFRKINVGVVQNLIEFCMKYHTIELIHISTLGVSGNYLVNHQKNYNQFDENDFYIVAEGIETEGQAKAASEKKLDRIQGFYYAKPLSGEELIAFLAGFQGEK